MKLRFYVDSETGRPHVENHGVTTAEAAEVLASAGQDYMGDQGARIAIGRTKGGRYLKVVYRPDEEWKSVFVITAYPLRDRELKAYKRRIRRRGK
jgi:uncharacterized DUF497 family protein